MAYSLIKDRNSLMEMHLNLIYMTEINSKSIECHTTMTPLFPEDLIFSTQSFICMQTMLLNTKNSLDEKNDSFYGQCTTNDSSITNPWLISPSFPIR